MTTTAQNKSIEQLEMEIRSTSYEWNSSECCKNPTTIFEIRLEKSPSYITIECAMHEGAFHFSRHARGLTWGSGYAVSLNHNRCSSSLQEGLVMMLLASIRELKKENCGDTQKLLEKVKQKYLEVNQMKLF